MIFKKMMILEPLLPRPESKFIKEWQTIKKRDKGECNGWLIGLKCYIL